MSLNGYHEKPPGQGRGHFTLSMSSPPSEASSRASSPAPPYDYELDLSDHGTPGRKVRDVYEASFPWWRAAVRRRLVECVRVESKVIADMQRKIRTPWLDAYFVYTSSLGTHTFFMILLPAFFFFGHNEMGFGLLFVLAMGVHCASIIKDLFCSPRPFAPPVTRLTIGSHHLEYGFPSTHSTNSVSIALFFFTQVYDLFNTEYISPLAFSILSTLLVIYGFSIVFGRLYTAMHSFTDCVMGVLLGTFIWWASSSWEGVQIPISQSRFLHPLLSLFSPSSNSMTQTLTFPVIPAGLRISSLLLHYAQTLGPIFPLTLIPLVLLSINQHPQPVDDCPCFEDAIAFASVVLGALVGRWGVSFWWERPAGVEPRAMVWGAKVGSGGLRKLMPGSLYALTPALYSSSNISTPTPAYEYTPLAPTPTLTLIWFTTALVKMLLGVLLIFIWRLVAKSVFHVVLPPVFRLLSKCVELPRRRFYTPATEYRKGRGVVRLVDEDEGEGENGYEFEDRVEDEGEDENDVELEDEADEKAPLKIRGRSKTRHRHRNISLRPTIPSVIDLPTMSGVGEEVGGIGSGVGGVRVVRRTMRKVNGNGSSHLGNGKPILNGKVLHTHTQTHVQVQPRESEKKVKHYDADVLTKVMVYAGIAILATEVIPILFEASGLGVYSAPF